MILFIEGPRHSGKTYLINKFLEVTSDPRIEYYKFYFADHVKMLDITHKDSTDAFHYFSLGNIMTILEMNQRSQYANKIWVFDRAIISAYTWAILRGRLSETEAAKECKLLLESNLFNNCRTLLVKPPAQTGDSDRVKDLWDGAHSTEQEFDQMTSLIDSNLVQLQNYACNNAFMSVNNDFTEKAVVDFRLSCYELLGL